jgi:hypothetical protein
VLAAAGAAAAAAAGRWVEGDRHSVRLAGQPLLPRCAARAHALPRQQLPFADERLSAAGSAVQRSHHGPRCVRVHRSENVQRNPMSGGTVCSTLHYCDPGKGLNKHHYIPTVRKVRIRSYGSMAVRSTAMLSTTTERYLSQSASYGCCCYSTNCNAISTSYAFIITIVPF